MRNTVEKSDREVYFAITELLRDSTMVAEIGVLPPVGRGAS
jgi:hypothetical protein